MSAPELKSLVFANYAVGRNRASDGRAKRSKR